MKAVCFDMDGVIVDSEAHWKAVEGQFFERNVRGWKSGDNDKITGLGVEDLFDFLVRDFDFRMGKAEFLGHCEGSARKVYTERVDCAEGILDLARGLKQRGIGTALSTSAPRRWAALVIERFALSPLFDAVVTADDVGGKTKPAPDIYLETAARLNLPPGECLAIEDSSIGVLAAKRAGLKAAGYRTAHNEAQDLSAADFEISSFLGLDYDRLIARLRR